MSDDLNEMARNTSSYMDNLIEQVSLNSKNMLQRIESSEKKFDTSFDRLAKSVINEFNYSKMFFEDRLIKIETKLDSLINQSFHRTNTNLDVMSQHILDQLTHLERQLADSEEKVFQGLDNSSRSMNNQLVSMKTDSMDIIKMQIEQFQSDLRVIQQEISNIQRFLSMTSDSVPGISSF